MTRQMKGEPALVEQYAEGAYRAPYCPRCGYELSPCEDFTTQIIGDNMVELTLLGAMAWEFRTHITCAEVPREDLIRRIVAARK